MSHKTQNAVVFARFWECFKLWKQNIFNLIDIKLEKKKKKALAKEKKKEEKIEKHK